MPLPVITDTFRITLDWGPVTTGETVANVFHVHANGASETDVADGLEPIIEGWATSGNPYAALSNGFQLSQFTVLALDGVSAGIVRVPSPAPHGGASGEAIPQVAQIVSFYTTTRGPRGRGRQFIGPATESEVSGGAFTVIFSAAVETNWNAFNTALGAAATPMALCVASYAHATQSEVSDIVAKIGSGTQRRRMDRVR